jgi:hypothetical protein
MQLDPVAKILLGIGAMLIVTGVLWQFGFIQTLRLGRLPGDIRIEKENFSFYFPLTTCILISVVVLVIRWVVGK